MERVSRNLLNATKLIRQSRAALFVFLEAIAGIILSVLSLVIFIKLKNRIIGKELAFFDTSIIDFLYSLRSPLLNKIMLAISYIGGDLLIVVTILLIIILTLKRHVREAVLFGFILGMTVVINDILKKIIQRPRPDIDPLISLQDYSFPSGHAMDSFVFYATFSFLVFHFTRSKKLALISTILSTILIFLIGISRIYLGVHYPTDVIAGYLGGLFWFSSVMIINRTLIFFKLFKENLSK